MTDLSRAPAVRAVERDLRRHRLLAAGEAVLVAVSGGADSVLLLRALHALAPRWQLRLEVAHLDHGWRGREAAEDAAFVRTLAGALDLPYHGGAVDAPALARAERVAPEAAARLLRYQFLEAVCGARRLRTVAVGHTEDDQLETYLMAWLRGSGPAGLAGMDRRSPLPVPGAHQIDLVRPLLSLGRAEVRAALAAAGQRWREDASNEDPRRLRNRVRRELVPLLESLNPGARRSVLRAAGLAREAATFLDARAAEAAERLFAQRGAALVAERRRLLELEPALRGAALRCAVRRLSGTSADLEWAHVEGALQTVERGRGGAVAWLAPAVRLRLERGQVVVEHDGGAPNNP